MLGSPDLIERWRITQQEYLTDTPAAMAHQALDERRLEVQQEMMQLLVAFLNRTISLKEFNAMFQQKTQGAWNVFRMRGTSGGMYLNKLVKYIDDDTLTSHLRSGLRLPEDTREGQRHMAYAGTDPLFRAPDCSAQRITVSLATGAHSISLERVVAPTRCAPLAHLFPAGPVYAPERRRATNTSAEPH